MNLSKRFTISDGLLENQENSDSPILQELFAYE